MLGPKNIFVQKHFGLKEILCPKKCLVPKSFGSQINKKFRNFVGPGPSNFWAKKFQVQKHFDPNEYWVIVNVGSKNFGF